MRDNKNYPILNSTGKPVMLSNELDTPNFDYRLKSLENFKKFWEWIWAILGIGGAGIFLYFYSQLSDLNENIEKTKNEYISLKNSYEELQLEFTESDRKLKNNIKDFEKFCTETKNIVNIAKINAETALTKSGLLNDAINSAQMAANRACEANIKTQEKIIEYKKLEESIKNAYSGICETQRNLEAFLSKNLNLKQNKQFKVKLSGSFCSITVVQGDGIAYDRVIGGSSSEDLIVLPKDTTVVIEDSGSSNDIYVSSAIKDNVVITGNGRHRTLKIIK